MFSCKWLEVMRLRVRGRERERQRQREGERETETDGWLLDPWDLAPKSWPLKSIILNKLDWILKWLQCTCFITSLNLLCLTAASEAKFTHGAQFVSLGNLWQLSGWICCHQTWQDHTALSVSFEQWELWMQKHFVIFSSQPFSLFF